MIISLLTYAVVLKMYTSQFLNWFWASFLAVFVPWLLNGVVLLISTGTPYNSISSAGLTTVIVQFAISLLVFRLIESQEDSVGRLIGVGVLGGLVMYIVLPYVVTFLPGLG